MFQNCAGVQERERGSFPQALQDQSSVTPAPAPLVRRGDAGQVLAQAPVIVSDAAPAVAVVPPDASALVELAAPTPVAVGKDAGAVTVKRPEHKPPRKPPAAKQPEVDCQTIRDETHAAEKRGDWAARVPGKRAMRGVDVRQREIVRACEALPGRARWRMKRRDGAATQTGDPG